LVAALDRSVECMKELGISDDDRASLKKVLTEVEDEVRAASKS